MLKATNIADKILVLGVDGMDPVLTKQHIAEGIMPNLEKFLAKGAAREDLHMLGSHPTITPPMWTTLATGAHPYVHSITDFWRQSREKLDTTHYNLDSTLCQAEQIWNVFAEAGRNTVVWHWSGSSWPPSSESPNLTVVDGTQPEGINQGTGQIWSEFIAVASEETEVTTFKVSVGESAHMCVITDLEEKQDGNVDMQEYMHFMATAPDIHIIQAPRDNDDDIIGSGSLSNIPLDISLSPIKPAHGWANAPEDAKEATILFSRGLVRRPVLILKNAAGVYDRVALYKNKKEMQPIAILENNVFTQDVIDEAIKKDVHYDISRNMRVLELKPDGSYFRIWCSAETNIHDNKVWSPQPLFDEIVTNVGYPQPISNLGSYDDQLIRDCMQENWMRYIKWQADCLHYMIEKKGAEIIFSHIHNDDAQKHMFVQLAKEPTLGNLPAENYIDYLRNISRQTDYYIGRFLHLLDEGWTILLVSDHGLTCSLTNISSPLILSGVKTTEMIDWGFTQLKKDENGNYINEIDWANTKAIMTRMNEIYINLKGKYPTGIVDPADKWELEEEIITKLYGLTSKTTGKRMVSVAVRNKDAVHFGLGGPECGDIVFFTTDGYNTDHGDGLSTCIGASHTSQSPIFAAAGKGIKQGYKTSRVIREIDVAPTVAVLGGVRMPANAEGAPVYQILED